MQSRCGRVAPTAVAVVVVVAVALVAAGWGLLAAG